MAPDMRVCIVDDNEDFTLAIVTDPADATLSVEIVDCGDLSDFRVRIVDATSSEAAEYALVI